RNEVLALVFIPQERLPELDRAAFEYIDQPEEEQHRTWSMQAGPRHQVGNQRHDQADHRAPKVAEPGEALVRRILVHAPRCGMKTREKAEKECDRKVGHGY